MDPAHPQPSSWDDPGVRSVATAGLGFLLAVLWMDLMFDRLAGRTHGPTLPEPALDEITRYYRRVTTEARPMGTLVALVMAVTLSALIAQGLATEPTVALLVATFSTGGAVILAATRTVRSARRLGAGQDDPSRRSRIAREIRRDHILCFAAITVALLCELAGTR